MRAIGKHLARLGKVAAAQIFEQDRQVIRQLARRKLEAARSIEPLEIDHGLAAVAAVAMQMLEQMERRRAPAVEQVDITLLGLEQIAVGELVDQRQAGSSRSRDVKKRRASDQLRDLRQRLPQIPRG